MVLCIQNSVISTRITNLYGSLPSSVVFACKTATFGPEIQVSTGPRHHLSLFACNTACFVPELLLSMGPSPRLRFLHAKQRLLYRISNLYGSQTSPVVLYMQYSVIRTRITSLYGSQTSPVILCLQNSVISIRKTGLYGSQPSSQVFACKTEPLDPNNMSL